jgi:hypothetical protein
MKGRIPASLLSALILIGTRGTAFSFAVQPVAAHSRAELDRAIVLGAGYLDSVCSPEGEFAYQVDTLSAEESSSYNIVRHAGAMYALGLYWASHRDARAAAALARAANYMRKNYIGPGIGPGQLAVWSKPQPGPSKAELGATGLGLVALVEARRADPRTIPLKDLQALGRFLLFLQKRDGSFYNRYSLKTGLDADWQSLYYPGEAALGLISLYEADHSRQWLNAAAKALAFLAKSRAGSPGAPPDHWALIATARLRPYCARGGCPASWAELVRHAEQISNALLSAQQIGPDNPALEGAFDEGGRIAPAATCIEGLLAALEILPREDTELRARIEIAATRGVAFLLRAQIVSGPYAGGMPRAYIFGTAGEIPVRIDYVQHSMSAWIRYEEQIERR